MRVLQGILLSLFIHFFFMWSAQFAPVVARKLAEKPITVEIIDKNESQDETSKQKQIVRDAPAPEDLKTHDSEDPLSFLSARDQRVKKQMQAQTSGMTKNRSNQENSPPATRATKPAPRSPKSKINPQTRGGTLDAFTPKYRKAPVLPQTEKMDPGFSTIGEALPKDVAVGSFTALNTDRYLYYSFFSRIEEMVRFRWETAVRDAIDATPAERLNQNASGIWTTHMEVWLKPNGEVHSTHVMKEAGLKRFDLAATRAFTDARMFPNPPEEMVGSDGLIHLKYSFQVRYEPKVLVKSRD